MSLIDNEIKALAAGALRNAFSKEFSALVNSYLAASEGLIDDQEIMIGELTSIYARDQRTVRDFHLDIWVKHRSSYTTETKMLTALAAPNATEIHLKGEKIFERRGGEWYAVS